DLDREQVPLARLVGNREQHLARRLLRLPARLDRRKLRRLMLEHVQAGQVAEEELDWYQHRAQSEAPMQHPRASARWTPRSSQAPVAATHMPVVRKAASSMCGQRTRMIGPVVIAHQSAGIILPSTIVWPSGTCIQLLLARIQNEENIVPSETMQQA